MKAHVNEMFERRVQAAKATVAHQLRSFQQKGTVYKPKGGTRQPKR